MRVHEAQKLMQVAGECFANSEKSYHAAVTILKIKLIIFFTLLVSRKSLGTDVTLALPRVAKGKLEALLAYLRYQAEPTERIIIFSRRPTTFTMRQGFATPCRTVGLSDCRAVGLSGCRIVQKTDRELIPCLIAQVG
ncbi:hypothetical protein [Microcoleus sp. B13-B6]|uniref:hypothetical protein n=1 Tax=Microcoleus sp. B13-B6 TaxID=2818652 RepID=UPI002FD78048